MVCITGRIIKFINIKEKPSTPIISDLPFLSGFNIRMEIIASINPTHPP